VFTLRTLSPRGDARRYNAVRVAALAPHTPLKILLLALAAMFLQQTFVAIGKILPAVIAPAIVADLEYDPAWVGAYFGLTSFWALLFQMSCGSFIVRYGAMRVSQASLVMLAVGLGVMVEGGLMVFLLSAIIAGGGSAVSTPASSHLLGRFSPVQYAPLVFSMKQTAVPAGLLLAGFLGPLLATATGWRGAMLIVAGACLVFALVLQPLRERFDDDRIGTLIFSIADVKATLKSVVRTRELRSLSFACFAFNAVQMVVTTYFVIYLTTLGYSLAAAGVVFSTAVAVAIPGRILWGWIGSLYVEPRIVLAGLAFGMAATAALLAAFDASWPVLLIGACASVLSATALSWHGIILSETARLAPEGQRGAVTGGILSFGQLGAMMMPLVYSGLLALTGSYAIGFVVCGIPALLVGFDLLRTRGDGARLPLAPRRPTEQKETHGFPP
jgi:MFS family permease